MQSSNMASVLLFPANWLRRIMCLSAPNKLANVLWSSLITSWILWSLIINLIPGLIQLTPWLRQLISLLFWVCRTIRLKLYANCYLLKWIYCEQLMTLFVWEKKRWQIAISFSFFYVVQTEFYFEKRGRRHDLVPSFHGLRLGPWPPL